MKVYVGAKFEEKGNAREAQAALRALGHEITFDWTVEDDSGLSGDERELYWRACGANDVDGVRRADAVLLLNHPLAFGTMVEFGLALAWGKPIFLVGADIRNTVFFWVPGIRRFNTVEQAVRAIDAH